MCARLPDDDVKESATNVASQRGGSGDEEDGKLAALLSGVAFAELAVEHYESRHEEAVDVMGSKNGMVLSNKDIRMENENKDDVSYCRNGIKAGAKALGDGVNGLDVVLLLMRGLKGCLMVYSSLFPDCCDGLGSRCYNNSSSSSSSSSSSNAIKSLLSEFKSTRQVQ